MQIQGASDLKWLKLLLCADFVWCEIIIKRLCGDQLELILKIQVTADVELFKPAKVLNTSCSLDIRPVHVFYFTDDKERRRSRTWSEVCWPCSFRLSSALNWIQNSTGYWNPPLHQRTGFNNLSFSLSNLYNGWSSERVKFYTLWRWVLWLGSCWWSAARCCFSLRLSVWCWAGGGRWSWHSAGEMHLQQWSRL